MLKIIDLDTPVKDADGIVFTLSINGEKTGFSEQEIVELLRARQGISSSKAGPRGKSAAVRGKPPVSNVEQNDDADGGEEETHSHSGSNGFSGDSYASASA